MSQHLAVVVMAAGAGTRMKSKTPKVLHNLCGIPLISHVLATATALAPGRLLAVLRHEKQQIAEYLEQVYSELEIVEQDEIPGTGRAAQVALDALGEDFNGAVVILSGDVPLLDVQTLEQMIDLHLSQNQAATLLTTELTNPFGYGRVIRSRGEFEAIVEQRDASEQELAITEINAGVYVFDAQALRAALSKLNSDNSQGELYLTDAVGILAADGSKVGIHQINDPWLVAGINDRVQLSEVSEELNRRIVTAWQLSGVTVVDPKSTQIDVTVTIGSDTLIEPNVQLRGATRIGEDCVIGPDSMIVDSEIATAVTVVKSHLTQARIGEQATIGPFSFLRPGTDLGTRAKIGAFVETKNAIIGDGSKVPHLSYVGDAEIGVESNIGAGTIFANYDGVNKHRTRVGDHVRTGSSNVFVAPVSIESGAYTAAGTVVRKDVASGDLAMNHSPQRAIVGWVLAKRPGSASAKAAEQK